MQESGTPGGGKRRDAATDLGVLAGRLLFSVQGELFRRLHREGFADIAPRHGSVLAYLRVVGIRATELSRLSGQHKQVVGKYVDELEALGYVERRPDPDDRRAKLVVPTERGRAQMRTADAIMTEIGERHRHSRQRGVRLPRARRNPPPRIRALSAGTAQSGTRRTTRR